MEFGLRSVAFVQRLTTTPPCLPFDALRDEIRRSVADSIADSMRAHGLTPARDMEDDDEDGA